MGGTGKGGVMLGACDCEFCGDMACAECIAMEMPPLLLALRSWPMGAGLL